MRKSLPRFNAPLPVEKSKPPALIDPISVRIAVAVTMTGLSRSRLYELIKSGELEIVKDRSSTLIIVASLREAIERRRSR
ncbi:excisionase [Sphingobium psychrophilum]|uniref:excisionase n=1 Tax=Sphingobium psychrophilum TaxID=2728834 RepID=UPI002E2C8306|nr:excisionase [Sphingobium psychrophilum]